MSDSLIRPHGGTLVHRVVDAASRRDAAAQASRLKSVRLNAVQYSDVCCIATGVFSPLTGFAGRRDYESIVERMRLADGTVWSIPVTLAVDAGTASSIGAGDTIALHDPNGRAAATMEVTEQFRYDKKREAVNVYRTEEQAHPGVARLYAQGDMLLAGPI